MKKAIIIGATSGIGRALAESLVHEGYVVGVTGRREDLLNSIQEKHPGKIFARKMDVQDVPRIESICDELVAQMGGLDIFIIAAGIGEENKELNFEIENEVIKTNIQGFTCLADWSMSYFKKQGHGHLVNISSIAGIRGNGLAPSYNASKAYQINYLEGLRLNAHRSNIPINVTDVRPGFVDTAMAKGKGMFWVAPVKKAADQIYDAIKRKKQVVYVTKRWRLIGYILKVIPYSILRRI
ncbi:MAG: SDR family NAD(P)-dependent oxidoreductase [bacterium]|jgi:short-subunit dehydrogenase